MPSPVKTPNRARSSVHQPSRLSYPGTLAMLAIACAFPIALMVFNPTLMFERGWEQYVGTAIYFWAVATLGLELIRLWRNESAFGQASGWLGSKGEPLVKPGAIAEDDQRVLAGRVRQLAGFAEQSKTAPAEQLMEVNREGSGLDQEQAAGRFTLPRYILYLLPVIGFIGTVEGISKALMNISLVLPMVKDLDGFMSNLTSVTSALQVAFDSTLLALFLSAALMLVLTLVYRRSEDQLARVDRWVVEQVLPRAGASAEHPLAAGVSEALAPHLEAMRRDLMAAMEPATRALQELSARMGEGLGPHVDRFADSVDRLPNALAGLHEGAQAMGRLGEEFARLGTLDDGVRRGVGILGRIEVAMANVEPTAEPLEEIKRGLDRTTAAIEGLSESWASSFERSSRSSQEQLARTLHSLKDALDLLNVSMEQGNALYRSIVKRTFSTYPAVAQDTEAA
ncbi:MotA/TolQ/ExbB proton channel family protein [Tundrisphaera lichenicola]|uniref:MotA/TolQ/ExbB proton channel family protein n=1 Tax=Tundrisphaera lichenicola TaxID=2029860 RepID=UPI003EBB5818